MAKKEYSHKIYAALLLCFLQVAGIDLYAQEVIVADSTGFYIDRLWRQSANPAEKEKEIKDIQEEVKKKEENVNSERQDTNVEKQNTNIETQDINTQRQDNKVESQNNSVEEQQNTDVEEQTITVAEEALPDSLSYEKIIADSIVVVNEQNTGWLTTGDSVTIMRTDSAGSVTIPDKKVWTPNPTKATWLAVVFPGGGQIYNRKYWKLPIIYGGFAGCAYALNWNNNMYKDYAQAYLDIMDKDPTTNSYLDLLRPGLTIDENTDTQYGPRLKKQKDYYRRYRDISVFAFIGVYLLSIIDAYVDAELSNFDITPDISMRVEPTVINNDYKYRRLNNTALGLQCSISF